MAPTATSTYVLSSLVVMGRVLLYVYPPRLDPLDGDPAPDRRLEADARADGDHILEPAEADGDGAGDAVRVLVVHE